MSSAMRNNRFVFDELGDITISTSPCQTSRSLGCAGSVRPTQSSIRDSFRINLYCSDRGAMLHSLR